jgi:hypothetical protein
MTKARENSDYTGLQADITAGDTAARAGRKNLIINGGFDVWQRGDYTTAITAANTVYYPDRFYTILTGVTATIQNTTNSAKIAATSSGTGYIGWSQSIEDKVYSKFNSKTLTLSAKVTTNNSNVRLRAYNGSTWVDAPTQHSGNGTEETLTYTFPVVANPNDLKIQIITYTGGTVSITSGDYIEVADVQLELGSVATDFEHRSYGEELALCQRYYQKYGGTAYATIASGMQPNTTNAKFHLSYMQEMRSVPSLNASNVANLIVTDRTAFDQPLSGFTGHAIGKTSAYMSAQFSAVGATGRGILLAVKNGTTTTVNLDAEL